MPHFRFMTEPLFISFYIFIILYKTIIFVHFYLCHNVYFSEKCIEDTELQWMGDSDSGYSVHLQSLLYDHSLQPETLFRCELSIPKTEYKVHREVLYYPGNVNN